MGYKGISEVFGWRLKISVDAGHLDGTGLVFGTVGRWTF